MRQKDWFDHYLKGAPAPEWMTNGIPRIKMDEYWQQLKAQQTGDDRTLTAVASASYWLMATAGCPSRQSPATSNQRPVPSMSLPEITPVEEPKDLGFGSVVGGAMKSGCSIATGRSIPVVMGCRFFVRSASITISSRSPGRSSSRSWSPATCGANTRVRASPTWRAASTRSSAPSRRAWADRSGARSSSASRRSAPIGYGNITPNNFPAHIVMTVGVAGRPVDVRARDGNSVLALLASDRGVDVQLDARSSRRIADSPAFMFRMTNARSNQLVELEVEGAVLAHRGSASQVRPAHARADVASCSFR